MISLDEQEQRWLAGADGPAMQLAMELMVAAANVSGADSFVPIEFAHINSSFYSGPISTDFAEFLVREGATLAVPTHTNASLIDCTQPNVRPADRYPDEVAGATRLMQLYEQLGCTPMWSCAPYHEARARPGLGTHLAGSESNAVSFFNSVLGARTNKYGDFLDICAAITGRVPHAGLHTDEGRLATHVIRLDISDRWRTDARLHHVLGIVLGIEVDAAVPVIDGLDACTETELKAIAAAGGTSGAVEMFHVVASTPEAPTLDAALGGRAPAYEVTVDDARLDDVAAQLTTAVADTGAPNVICLGTPHFSIDEFADLVQALDGQLVAAGRRVIVTTSRAVHAELTLRGWAQRLADAGVEIVLDTCSYYTPAVDGVAGHVMTNSAKWAYYAPGILGVEVTFGSLEACVSAAVSSQ